MGIEVLRILSFLCIHLTIVHEENIRNMYMDHFQPPPPTTHIVRHLSQTLFRIQAHMDTLCTTHPHTWTSSRFLSTNVNVIPPNSHSRFSAVWTPLPAPPQSLASLRYTPWVASTVSLVHSGGARLGRWGLRHSLYRPLLLSDWLPAGSWQGKAAGLHRPTEPSSSAKGEKKLSTHHHLHVFLPDLPVLSHINLW